MRKPSDERLSYCGCSRGGLINFAVANRGTDRVRCEQPPSIELASRFWQIRKSLPSSASLGGL